jgi:hypothetical protein
VWIAEACIDHLRHFSKELVPTGYSNLIRSMMSWINMLMFEHVQQVEDVSSNKQLKHWLNVIDLFNNSYFKLNYFFFGFKECNSFCMCLVNWCN